MNADVLGIKELNLSIQQCDAFPCDVTMELYWYIVVIIFIIVKIFFYICWYRSRQRQLHAYLSNPRNAQIVIVGGRAYLQQICERQRDLVWSNWYGVQDDVSVGEPSGTLPPAPSYSQLEEVPPPYEAVPREDSKPPPYSEFSPDGSGPEVQILTIPENCDAYSLTDAPPPYTPSPTAEPVQQDNMAPPYSQAVGQSEMVDAQKPV